MLATTALWCFGARSFGQHGSNRINQKPMPHSEPEKVLSGTRFLSLEIFFGEIASQMGELEAIFSYG